MRPAQQPGVSTPNAKNSYPEKMRFGYAFLFSLPFQYCLLFLNGHVSFFFFFCTNNKAIFLKKRNVEDEPLT